MKVKPYKGFTRVDSCAVSRCQKWPRLECRGRGICPCWYPRPASSFREDTQKLRRSVTGRELPDEPRRRRMTGQKKVGSAQVQEEALSPQ
jgi:hypothetical protein